MNSAKTDRARWARCMESDDDGTTERWLHGYVNDYCDKMFLPWYEAMTGMLPLMVEVLDE